ncbi:Imidazolonepropionase [Nocardioides terrae]|uniref:Imidazolonepropionase n=1 Tax=Nocardioides terrae TaxID=574651 RepID=A0A1I1K8P8_9ACTN|nr:amidohydrolase family protein [Nocardioides terrae]SFC56935.1 Imidazolonepropionase [Nocardioides terrae]
MSRPLAITHATVVTGDARGTLLEDRTITVDDSGLITTVAPTAQVEVPVGARVIDATGRFVQPGLINAHAHLFSDGKPLKPVLADPRVGTLVARFLRGPIGQRWLLGKTRNAVETQLNTGVTTIRSVGDPGYEVVQVDREIREGRLLGPRLIPSGPLLAIPGGHGAPQIALIGADADTVRKHVRRSLSRGVRAIKISATAGVTDAKEVGYAGRPEMTEANMRVICEEAHQAGVLVAAHAQGADGIRAALRAGVDTIEHGANLTDDIIDLFKNNPSSLRGFSALIPTLMACLPLVKLDRAITGANEVAKVNAEMIFEEMLGGIRIALECDILLGMGTDSALTFVTHYNTWRELDFLIRYAGLTPAQALHAATQANARILGVEDVTGAVEPGRAADLVVTSANPLTDIRTLDHPISVVVRGHVIDHPKVERFAELDQLIDQF